MVFYSICIKFNYFFEFWFILYKIFYCLILSCCDHVFPFQSTWIDIWVVWMSIFCFVVSFFLSWFFIVSWMCWNPDFCVDLISISMSESAEFIFPFLRWLKINICIVSTNFQEIFGFRYILFASNDISELFGGKYGSSW